MPQMNPKKIVHKSQYYIFSSTSIYCRSLPLSVEDKVYVLVQLSSLKYQIEMELQLKHTPRNGTIAQTYPYKWNYSSNIPLEMELQLKRTPRNGTIAQTYPQKWNYSSNVPLEMELQLKRTPRNGTIAQTYPQKWNYSSNVPLLKNWTIFSQIKDCSL